MSSAYAAPLVDLDAIDPQRLPRGLLDVKICQACRVVVLSKRGNRLTVATADPSDQEAIEKIKFATQLGVDWVIAEYDKVLKLVDANSVSATETMEEIIGGEFEFDEAAADGGSDNDQAAVSEVDDAPVVKFLHKMLLDAFSMRASDLHFEPYEHTYRVRFRIDGELREIAAPPIAIKDKLASRIKVISKMDISEKRVPARRQDEAQDRSQQGDRFSRQHAAHAVRRKNRDPYSRPEQRQAGGRCTGLRTRRKAPAAGGDRPALRHDSGDRPDRLGQDGVAVHLPESAEQARREHRHGRRSVRDQLAGRQPGQRQRQGRPDLCRRAEVVPAPGSRHHHGGRDPRPRDRRHRHQGGPDRTPGVVDAAHQRCTHHVDAHAQHGHCPVQHRLERHPDHRPAPRTPPVHQLQGGYRHTAEGLARRRLQGRPRSTVPGLPTARSAVPCATADTRGGSASTR